MTDRKGTAAAPGPQRGRRKPLDRLRAALLGTAAAHVLLIATPHTGHAQIVPPAEPCDTISGGGTTVTCTGNLQPGIELNNGAGPFTNLNVNTLNQNIAPADGVVGIFFASNGDVNIVSDTDPFAITTTNAPGIEARSTNGGVMVTQTGTISTQGDNAYGIFASSAGGDVRVEQEGEISTQGNDAKGIYSFSNGGEVTVTQTGAISTEGNGAYGIYARSSGDGEVTVTHTGTISTEGDYAYGIQAFSNDGDVTVTPTGTISTQGKLAAGIDARSTNGDVTVTQTGEISTEGADAEGIYAVSNGGDVTVTQTGTITTEGNNADGIFAESNDGDVTVTQTGTISTQRNYSDGINANSTNGPVTVTQTGTISTQGNNAEGIFAESEDGDVTVTQTGTIRTRGEVAEGIFAASEDGDVTVTQTGTISTQALFSDGIYAYSENGDVTVTQTGTISTQGRSAPGINAYSENGDVTVTQTGTISTQGRSAPGIYAFSSSGDISITLNGGSITSAQSEGVEFLDGVDNSLTINNAVTISGGTFDVLGGNGNETINNFGTFTAPGVIDLGGGTNTFNNMAGALFNAGTDVNLGAGNFLNNDGTLSPGGLNTVLTTTLGTGNYRQSATGIFNIDVDFTNGVSDRLVVNLGDAMLDGLVVGNFFNPQAVLPGQQGQVTILTTPGGVVTNNGIMAQDTAVVDYTLLFIGNNQVDLTAFIDFSPTGLNQNQTALGETVNAIQTLGGSAAFTPVVAGLLRVPDLASLADAYDQLGPEIYLDNGIATLFSTLDFTDDLMSCEVREGGNVFINEGQCIWAKGSGAWFDQDKTAETIGFDRDAIRFAGGGQVALAPDWRVGMAFGYEHSDLDVLGGRQNSDADTIHGGAVIKYLFGDGLIAAAISGGQGWYDTTRNLGFGGFTGQSAASHDVSHLNGRLRGAYAFTNGAHYIKPMVDLNISYIDVDGFTETGGNGAALIVNGTDETVFSVSPAVEFGWQSALADGTLLRPYIRAGVTVFDDPELVLTSRFAAAPAGAPSFRTVVGTDDVVGDIAAGLDVLTNDGTVLKVYYSGQFGDDTEQQSFGAKVNLPF